MVRSSGKRSGLSLAGTKGLKALVCGNQHTEWFLLDLSTDISPSVLPNWLRGVVFVKASLLNARV